MVPEFRCSCVYVLNVALDMRIYWALFCVVYLRIQNLLWVSGGGGGQ